MRRRIPLDVEVRNSGARFGSVAASPAVDDNGQLAYSVLQQGAGMIDAYAAVHGTAAGCANRGLDINLDITGQLHCGGRANVDENGNYYLMGLEGYMWTDSLTETAGVNYWVGQE